MSSLMGYDGNLKAYEAGINNLIYYYNIWEMLTEALVNDFKW